jgi:hypothetical protein
MERARERLVRAMVMATRVAVEEEGNDKGRKSNGNRDKEDNGNGNKEGIAHKSNGDGKEDGNGKQ